MIKALITGSRTWADREAIAAALVVHRVTEIAQGGALGADCLAWRVASALKIKNTTYSANWIKHGKAAGPIRNGEMLADFKPDIVLAFWDGQSHGTRDMIDKSRKAGLTVWVYFPDGSRSKLAPIGGAEKPPLFL